MRDVNYGWMIRYLHANTASFFFLFVYLHIGRGLYYGSYKSPRALPWSIGVIILILMMATAFLGIEYTCPKWLDDEMGTLLMTSNLIISPNLKSLLDEHKIKPCLVFEGRNKDDVPARAKRGPNRPGRSPPGPIFKSGELFKEQWYVRLD